jgi:hypothetical protein
VIGPGWLPRPLARPSRKRRTLAYTRLRRRSPRAPKSRAVAALPAHNDLVLFDQGPSELPVATVVPHEMRSRALVWAGALRRWIAARWDWFRPRTVPVIAAVFGMLFVLASADYLAHVQGEPHSTAVLLMKMR